MKKFILILLLLFIMPSFVFGAPIITIDHTSVDKFDNIPPQYITSVKQMTFHYPGASHARQMQHGMELLEASHSNYAFEFEENANNFNEPNTLNELEDGSAYSYDYFTAAGIATVKTRIQAAITAGYQPEVSLIGWSYNFCNNGYDGAYDSGTIQEYIDALVTQNADEDINDTVFVYHTSIMEANCSVFPSYADREEWNQMIRDAASTNEGILFDQADIEVWNNDNTEARSDPIRAHADYEDGTEPDVYTNDHANDLICIRKAKAMWVLLAMIAGWDGSPGTTDGDADGILDNTDNCPGIANPGQKDADNDGIGDVCDDPVVGEIDIDFKDYDLCIWDFSGTYAESQEGMTLSYIMSQDPKGKVTGSGTFSDQSDGNNLSIPFEIKGRVKGINSIVTLKYKVKGKDAEGNKIINVLMLELNESILSLVGTEKRNICANGEGCEKREEGISLYVPDGMTGEAGLLIDATLDEKGKLEGTAELTLSNGDEYPLSAKGKSKNGETKLSLKGTNGIKFKLIINEGSGDATSVKAKVLGQKLNQTSK